VDHIPNKKEATETKPAKPGKDKAVKIATTTTITGCTGTETAAGLTVPSGGTETGKSGLPSRLITNAGNTLPGKSTVVWSDGSKSKSNGAGSTETFVDNGTPNDHSDDIALPDNIDDVIALIVAGHGTDSLYLLGTGGGYTGKAYANHHADTVGHSPGILAKLQASQTPAGLGSITTTGTLHVYP
jgi:hypothetical protein